MIPNRRKKRQKESGFPLETAKRLYNLFGESGQDMTFQQFYTELCGLSDEKKMKEDLSEIEIMKARERSGRLLIDRTLHAN